MSFLNRVLSLVWNDGGQQDHPATPASPKKALDKSAILLRMAELEQHIERQNRQLGRARALLQNAAFLAGYHQPSLERDIRALLTEMDARDAHDTNVHAFATGTQNWKIPPPNATNAAA